MNGGTLQYVMSISGNVERDGKLPLSLVARKLEALQTTFRRVGSAIEGQAASTTTPHQVEEACTLLFVRAGPGNSVNFVTQLAEAAPGQLPHTDIGSRTYGYVQKTWRAVKQHDGDALAALFPNRSHRQRVVSSMLDVLPEEGASYDVRFQENGQAVSLGPVERDFLTELPLEPGPPEEGVTSIKGRLYWIKMDAQNRQFRLAVGRRRVRCDYGQDKEDLVRDLMVGSLVEVRGQAEMDDHGDVRRITEVTDVWSFDLRPLAFYRVQYENRVFHLRQPIQVRVDYRDGLWLYEYEPLGILAYGEKREECRSAFSADFAACWDVIALKDDSQLTCHAVDIKRRFLDIVDHTEGTE